jgi:hypothetical protein
VASSTTAGGDAVTGAPVGFLLESGAVSFDEVIPGIDVERPGAVSLRVVSDRRWSLELAPDSRLLVSGEAASVPISRLSWRTGPSDRFAELRAGRPVVVASGSPTTGAGVHVSIDLRLRLEGSDPLGHYQTNLQLIVQSR